MTERMIKLLQRCARDPKQSDDTVKEIKNRMKWLEELTEMLGGHGYMDSNRGPIQNVDDLLRAVDNHRLVNRSLERQDGIEDSVRWNVSSTFMDVFEMMLPPEEPIDWFNISSMF